MFRLYNEAWLAFGILFVIGLCAFIIYACAKSAKEEWDEGGKTPSSLGKILGWVLFIVIFGIGLVGALSMCTHI